MPSVVRILPLIFITLWISLSACGDSDKTATFDPETSVHPPGWLPAQHAVEAGADAGACTSCHGEDLITGGISGVSCTGCHIGGPLDEHPREFNGEPWLTGHGDYVVARGLDSCRNVWCHGFNLQGVQQSGPGCDECHNFP